MTPISKPSSIKIVAGNSNIPLAEAISAFQRELQIAPDDSDAREDHAKLQRLAGSGNHQ